MNPPFDTHSAEISPGTDTNGVVTGALSVVHGPIGTLPSPAPFAPRMASVTALPPPSAAGLVQAATMPGLSITRAKRLFSGGGESARKVV